MNSILLFCLFALAFAAPPASNARTTDPPNHEKNGGGAGSGKPGENQQEGDNNPEDHNLDCRDDWLKLDNQVRPNPLPKGWSVLNLNHANGNIAYSYMGVSTSQNHSCIGAVAKLTCVNKYYEVSGPASSTSKEDESCKGKDGAHGCAGIWDPPIGKCVDIDECKRGTHNCNLRTERCVNEIGTGFHCDDINECAEKSHNCNLAYTRCVNEIRTGFHCDDINECAEGKHNCNSGYQSCVNQIKSGFHCQYVNRCSYGNHNCNLNYQRCVNTNTGSGFRCDDINECAYNNGGCGTSACTNTATGHYCG